MKKTIKSRIVPATAFILQKSGLLKAYELATPTVGIVSVNYHGTSVSDSVSFEQQIKFLSENYNCLSESDLSDILSSGKAMPANSLVITFDDGYRCNFDVAYPVLMKYQTPAIFFLLANAYTGEDAVNPPWSKMIKSKFLLKKQQVLELLQNGFSVGCHTCTHADLGKTPPENLEYEIVESKKKLEDLFQFSIASIAIPFGTKHSYTSQAIKLAQNAYRFIFHSFPNSTAAFNQKSIGRYCLEPGFTISEVRVRLSGIMDLRYARAKREFDRCLS